MKRKGCKNHNPYANGAGRPRDKSGDSPYFESLEQLRKYCLWEDLPFREILIDAIQLWNAHWTGASGPERREYRKKLARRINGRQ